MLLVVTDVEAQSISQAAKPTTSSRWHPGTPCYTLLLRSRMWNCLCEHSLFWAVLQTSCQRKKVHEQLLTYSHLAAIGRSFWPVILKVLHSLSFLGEALKLFSRHMIFPLNRTSVSSITFAFTFASSSLKQYEAGSSLVQIRSWTSAVCSSWWAVATYLTPAVKAYIFHSCCFPEITNVGSFVCGQCLQTHTNTSLEVAPHPGDSNCC